MIELWPEQQQMIADVRAAYRSGARAPLLVSPTGSGKTVMFCFMVANHVARGGRVIILVHRDELIDQVSETLTNFGVRHGFVAPDRALSPGLSCHVASVFSLVRKLDRLSPTLIIVDEAHHAVASTTWGRILGHYASSRVLGVTATPFRLSGEGLGESFDRLVLGPSTQELIDRGRLSPFRMFCPSAPDLSRVHRRAGELVGAEIEQQPDRPKIIGDAVRHYERLANGQQAVAFSISVRDAYNVADRFRQAGHQAVSLDGSMPSHLRRQAIQDFKARQLRVLTSCDLISEGFDCPGIEVGIFLRPTLSLGLWWQQVGRCLRTASGKREAILQDHAGNALRHGLPTEPRELTLAGCKSSNRDDKQPSVRVCPRCWAAMASHHRACKGCGYVFETVPRSVPKKEGELEEMTAEQVAALRYKESAQDKKSLEFLTALGRKRGYKNPEGWAQHVVDGVKSKKARKVRVMG